MTRSDASRRRWPRVLLAVVLAPIVVGAVGWATLALWFDGPSSRRLAGALAVGFVLAWWLLIPARNERDWQPDVARLATAEIDGDRVVIHNVRAFDYRTTDDFTERWEERAFD